MRETVIERSHESIMSAMISFKFADYIALPIFNSAAYIHILLVGQERTCFYLFEDISSFLTNILDVVSILEFLEGKVMWILILLKDSDFVASAVEFKSSHCSSMTEANNSNVKRCGIHQD